MYNFIRLFFIGSLFSLPVYADTEDGDKKEKHELDPTKVVTKLGVGYSDSLTLSSDDYILQPSHSFGGYVGAFALRPLNQSLTVIGFSGASLGSNDYSGYWVGMGLSYKLMQSQSLRAMASIIDDSFGSDNKVSFGYTYEFK